MENCVIAAFANIRNVAGLASKKKNQSVFVGGFAVMGSTYTHSFGED